MVHRNTAARWRGDWGPGLRWGAGALGLALMVATPALQSCSRRPEAALGGELVRLLDGAAMAYRALPDPPRPLALDAAAWQPILDLQGTVDPAWQAAQSAQAQVRADGLGLPALAGGFLQVVEVPPGTLLAFDARQRGPLSVFWIELSALPPDRSIAALKALRLSDQRLEPGPPAADGWAPLEARIEVSAETRAVALGIFGAPEGPSEIESLSLALAGFDQRVEQAWLLGDSKAAPGQPPIGTLRVGLDYRRALALAPGERATILAMVPGSNPRLAFAWSVGVGASGGRGGLSVIGGLDGGPLVELLVQEPVAVDRALERWREVELELPQEWAGQEVELAFLAADGEDPLFVAEPKLLGRPAVRRPGVLLISIDTLRADHLGIYGYPRPTSPNLDAFARDAWRFEHCWSQGAYTLPSHWSLLTGQFPSVHGVQAEADLPDRGRSPLLSQVLAAQGYETAAFTAGGYVMPEFGFGPGFDSFSVIDPLWNRESTRIERFIEAVPDLSRQTAEAVSIETPIAWVRRRAGRPYFLFMHTYAPHEFDPPTIDREALGVVGPQLDEDPLSLAWISGINTRPPRPIPEAAKLRLFDLYDSAIHQADRGVGRLLDWLDSADLLDQTLIAITSDHGKEIGDRGDVDHGGTLYEELVHVPLFLRLPGRGPGVSALPVMGVDVAPTLLGALGIRSPAHMQGQDLFAGGALLPSLPASARNRPLYSELDWVVKRAAWLRGSTKTIYTEPGFGWPDKNAPREESYDLAADPGEHHRLHDDEARLEQLLAFRQALRDLSQSLATGQVGTRQLSEESQRNLEALGYVVR